MTQNKFLLFSNLCLPDPPVGKFEWTARNNNNSHVSDYEWLSLLMINFVESLACPSISSYWMNRSKINFID